MHRSKEIPRNTFVTGNALAVLRTLPDNSVDCVVTSVPYWGQRDYGTAVWIGGSPDCDHKGRVMQTRANINKNTNGGSDKKNSQQTEFYKEKCKKCGAIRVDEQIGLEATPELFIEKMVEVFNEVYRVLKPWGTLWLNIGDGYAGSVKGITNNAIKIDNKYLQITNKGRHDTTIHYFSSGNIKPKDLMGVPWMLAFALRKAGWYLRQEIIWHKPNPMPESCTDRCTKSHEQIFLLTKRKKYYYDAEAIKTESIDPTDNRVARKGNKLIPNEYQNAIRTTESGSIYPMANKRSVWSVNTVATKEAHFATFPEKLIEPCILAGTSEAGVCEECGKPLVRIIEKIKTELTHKTASGWDLNEGSRGSIHRSGRTAAADKQTNHVFATQTTGWKRSCTHTEANVIPALVVDPFSGYGTTALVSQKKGRDFYAIDLNGKYNEMAKTRLYNELGIFNPINQ